MAALEGRPTEALAALRDARTRLLALELPFEAATYAVDALILLPDDPEVRGWADESRATFAELQARPWLERLDAALASPDAAHPAAGRSIGVTSAER